MRHSEIDATAAAGTICEIASLSCWSRRIVCLASGASNVVKSFIATVALQHILRFSLPPTLPKNPPSISFRHEIWLCLREVPRVLQSALAGALMSKILGIFRYNIQRNLGTAALGFGLVTGLCGFLLGSQIGSPPPAAFTIVPASAVAGGPLDSRVAGLDEDQMSATVGRLHADILTLRVLYKRLAEQAGLELSDFELDASVPTDSTQGSEDEPDSVDVSALMEQLSDSLSHVKGRSRMLKDWYQLRGQQQAFDLTGPVIKRGQISSRFGWRKRPGTNEMKPHKGVDFSGEIGEPVLALADGVVSFSGRRNAYGYMVELSHASGLTTRYAHNDSNVVSVGQRVEQGQMIAKLGSTGRSTGPHVHVEVHLDGEPVDPMQFIQ